MTSTEIKSYTEGEGGLITHAGLIQLIEDEVVENCPLENVNGASIDVNLAPELLIPRRNDLPDDLKVMWDAHGNRILDPLNREDISKHFYARDIPIGGTRYMQPLEMLLASTVQKFNLPPHIAAEYKLKSTLARCGLNHALAGWGDPWWNSSNLTLELQNMHPRDISILLTEGMKIGQIVFWEAVVPVPFEVGYARKGQYNGDEGTQAGKGVK